MIGRVLELAGEGSPGRAVGLDVGTSGVRAVIARRAGRHLRVERVCAAEIPRVGPVKPPPEAVAEALRGLLGGCGRLPSRVVVSVPLSSAVVRSITVPLQGRGRIRQVIKFHAEPHIPFPIEEVVVDFHEAQPAEGEGTPVLIAGVKKDLIARQLEAFAAAGVDPEIVTLDAFALANNYLMRARAAGDGGLVVLVKIGASRTVLVALRDGSIRLARSISVGGDDLTEAIQKELAVDFPSAERLKRETGAAVAAAGAGEEAKRISAAMGPVLARLVREADLSLRPLTTGMKGPVESRIYLAGGGALLGGMCEFWGREFGCETHRLSEIDGIPGERDGGNGADTGVATGLAAQGLGLAAVPVNLRREEFAHAGAAARARRQLLVGAGLALAIIGVLGYGFTVSLVDRRREHALLASEIERVHRETFPDGRPLRAAAVAADMLQRLEAYQKTFESYSALSGSAVSSLEVLREVSALMPQELKTQVTGLVIGQGTMEMDGLVNSPGDADRIKLALQKSPLFRSVEVPSTSSAGSGKHRFKLVAVMRGAGA